MSPTFASLGVPDGLVRSLAARDIIEPFPIQVATVPDALAGRDVCGRAPTGSGKTLAFGLALALRVTHASPKRPKALVLVPTRELAAQVRDELQALVGPNGRTVHAFYGGVGFGAQHAALRRGVDIAVACPGRLADLVQRGDIRLDRVDMVVVDEADRMADMGFLPEVRRLLDQVMPDRQTLLFSATLDGDVDTLIRRYQRDPVRHGVELAHDAPENHHVLWSAERDQRVGVCADVVSAHWPAIVFSRTKHGADRLARQLGKLGVAAEAIHGNRSQSQRERALRSFTSGRAQALVATDVAARGIHVDGVACVVHFDAPPESKDFVHRSGRTGRAGAEGLVVTLTTAADARTVTKMMRGAGVEVSVSAPDVALLGDPTARGTAPLPAPARPANGDGGRSRRTAGRPGRGRTEGRAPRSRDDRGQAERPRGERSGGGPRAKAGARTHRKGSGPATRNGSAQRDDRPTRVGEGGGARGATRRAGQGGGAVQLNHNGEARRSGPGPRRPGGPKPKPAGSRGAGRSGGGRREGRR